MQGLELLVEAAAPTTLEVELWDTGRPENYVPQTLQTEASAQVAVGRSWVKLDIEWTPDSPQNAFIVMKANNKLALHLAHEPLTGVLSFVKGKKPVVDARLEDHPEQPVVQWTMWPVVRKPSCFRVPSETAAFSPESVTDGYTRPYGSPHLWASEPVAAGEEAWLEPCWPSAVSLQDIHLTIYDDLNEDLINLHHRTPFEVIPELVWDYRIEACLEGG